MKLVQFCYLLLLIVSLLACSASEDTENKEHFASGQQRALEQAKNVGNVLQEAEEKKRQELENMER